MGQFFLLWILSVASTAYCYDFSYHEEEMGQSIEFRRPHSDRDTVTCRFSNNLNLPPQVFSLYACATCYRHIDVRLFVKGSKFTQKGIYLMDPNTNQTYLANRTDVATVIWESFRSDKAKQLWIKCCEAAEECCKKIQRTSLHDNSSFCPRTWDGWECWPDTLAGTSAKRICPWHVYFHTEPPECSRHATKICEKNGSWYVNENKNEWSNYTTCGRSNDIKTVLRAHVLSFSISIALLLPALGVLFVYKELQVVRYTMHKNLFLSLLFNAVFVIAFEAHYMRDSLRNRGASSVEANSVECRLFYTATKYFRLCTYMWMFCEGFYLHKLIAAAFTAQKNLFLFYIIGWVFPIFPVSIWGVLRHVYEDSGCWTVPYGHLEWVIFLPMLLAFLANFCFLSNIIFVVVSKLRSTRSGEQTQFRRAMKATLVLIPLFGLHFILVMYHPGSGACGILHIYTIVTYCVDGLQGAVVSIIFFYLNNEVLYLLKRSYRRRKLIRTVGSQMNSKKVTSYDSRVSISTNAGTVTDYIGSR